MKRFLRFTFVTCLVFLLVPLARAEASRSSVIQRNLSKQSVRYERLCPPEKQAENSCIALKKKISVLLRNLKRASHEVVVKASAPEDPALMVMKQFVIDLTNIERQQRGLALLRMNDFLAKAAQGHTDDMQQRDYMAHESPEGKTAVDRVKAAGYLDEFDRCQCNSSYTVGENLAKGQVTPAEVVQGWMDSAGHRKNILNPDFTEIGIGITKFDAEKNSGNFDPASYYWGQNFGNITLNKRP